MNFFKRLFTWWDGQTIGTQLFTWRRGTFVGDDANGNRFYQTSNGQRRWVIYNGLTEASQVSPEWHGWLHHTYIDAPTVRPLTRKDWEQPHQENLTGTAAAYVPAGSIRAAQTIKRADYEAWQPE